MNRLKWMIVLLRDILCIPIVTLMPRSRKKIVFGAWTGKQYGCNPKYLFEYVIRRGGFECYWIGDSSLRDKVLSVPGAKFVEKGSLRAFWHCLTAGTYVYNIGWKLDIINFPNCGKVNLIYTTHGYPDKLVLNRLDGHGKHLDEGNEPVQKGLRGALHNALVALNRYLYSETSWFSASSPLGDRLRVEGEPVRLSYDRALRAGLPRADFEIENASNAEVVNRLREKYANLLGVDPSKRWYLYVPTWRREAEHLFSFTKGTRVREFETLLREQNAIIIEKQHPSTIWSGMDCSVSQELVCVIDKDKMSLVDTQELQLASDRLITDYSSVYYDTVLMNKPVIHFVYDYDHFMNVSVGFAFDIRDFGGGPFAYDEEQLMRFMREPDAQLLSLRNPRTMAEHLTYEKGHSCEAYYELLRRLNQK